MPNDDQIKQMVDRFLCWRLPDDFSPDGGISFKPISAPQIWPVGTNLFTADQAEQMVRHMIGGDANCETHTPALPQCSNDVPVAKQEAAGALTDEEVICEWMGWALNTFHVTPKSWHLAVCWEVEERLTREQWREYQDKLVQADDFPDCYTQLKKYTHADAPARIKALAAVLRPEMENK